MELLTRKAHVFQIFFNYIKYSNNHTGAIAPYIHVMKILKIIHGWLQRMKERIWCTWNKILQYHDDKNPWYLSWYIPCSLSHSRICRPVMHPAALNLTHSLTTSESGPPSTNSAHNHAHQHLTLSPGILSPALDSIRIQWGSNGGRSHGNKEGHKNEKLGHHSLKGTCAHYNFIASFPDPIPSILLYENFRWSGCIYPIIS